MSEEYGLTDIKGIGPATASKLEGAGIKTVEQLAIMRPEELKSILGITLKAAKDMINDALDKALTRVVTVRTWKEHKEYEEKVVKRIPTGSAELDKLLGGGWKTTAIHLLKGEYATGKTQLAMQAAINCIKYLKRKVIWIETESGTASSSRIEEIARANGVTLKDDDIWIIPSTGTSPFAQFLAYKRAVKLIEDNSLDIGLWVVDSFNASFRAFYSGREMLPDRSKEEARHLGYLDHLASKYNMAIILTAQVMDIPDSGGQLGERVKTGHIKKVYGGNVLTHWATYILSLTKRSMDEWEAVMADAADRPFGKCSFRITSAGIRDSTSRSRARR